MFLFSFKVIYILSGWDFSSFSAYLNKLCFTTTSGFIVMVQSYGTCREDVKETFGDMGILPKVLFPYINFVPVSDISLENVKINMKLYVIYKKLKYAEN